MPDSIWNWPSGCDQIFKIYISILELQIFFSLCTKILTLRRWCLICCWY